MTVFYLWLSIISLMLMCAALVIELFAWLHTRGALQLYYTILLSIFSTWLILFTFLYFMDVFYVPLGLTTKLIMGLVRMVISSGLLYVLTLLSRFIITREVKKSTHIIGVAAAAVYSAGVILLTMLPVTIKVVSLIQVLFFAYCLFWVVRVLLFSKVLRRSKQMSLLLFYLLFGLYSIWTLILSHPALLVRASGSVQVLPRALFALLLGGGEMVIALIHRYQKEQMGERNAAFYGFYGLTQREIEIFESLFTGKTNKEIAEELYISERTVETHIYNIFRKCSVKNRMELVNAAGRFNLRGNT